MMHRSLVVAAALAFVASGAVAQAPRAVDGPQQPAIDLRDTTRAAGPVRGSNSFTEGMARSRIENKGYTNVTGLINDDDGIWRGRAMHGGQQVDVALDYQGNVFHGAAPPGVIDMTGPAAPATGMTAPAVPTPAPGAPAPGAPAHGGAAR
jgi:hypothetical protein